MTHEVAELKQKHAEEMRSSGDLLKSELAQSATETSMAIQQRTNSRDMRLPKLSR